MGSENSSASAGGGVWKSWNLEIWKFGTPNILTIKLLIIPARPQPGFVLSFLDFYEPFLGQEGFRNDPESSGLDLS